MKNSFFWRFVYATRGLRTAWASELSIKLEVLALIGILGFLVWFRPAPIWWAVILLVCGAVFAAELLNTALERALDKIHPVKDPLIAEAKDCAAASVFVLCLSAIGIFIALVFEVLSK